MSQPAKRVRIFSNAGNMPNIFTSLAVFPNLPFLMPPLRPFLPPSNFSSPSFPPFYSSVLLISLPTSQLYTLPPSYPPFLFLLSLPHFSLPSLSPSYLPFLLPSLPPTYSPFLPPPHSPISSSSETSTNKIRNGQLRNAHSYTLHFSTSIKERQ